MSMSGKEGKYNILVIGKTGVGKSSFVNYFLGRDVAKTGTGKYVTERGFYEYAFELDDFPASLYDSWGLEADKYEEWRTMFSVELENHGVEKPPSEWFHSVFYCISASGHRVENADTAIIKYLREEKYPVSVILTKCDAVTEEQEKDMKLAIRSELPDVNVISMSIGMKTRGGFVEPFGIDEIRQAARDDLFSNVVMRIPDHLRAMLKTELVEWKTDMDKQIENVGFFNGKKKQVEIEKAIEERIILIRSKLLARLKGTLQSYNKIMNVSGIPIGESKSRKMDDDLDAIKSQSSATENQSGDGLINMFALATIFSASGGIIGVLAGIVAVSAACKGIYSVLNFNKDVITESFDEIRQKIEKDFRKWIDDVEKNLISMKKRKVGFGWFQIKENIQ